MNNATPEVKQAAETIITAIRVLAANHPPPLLVALDGGSGAGKSVVAEWITATLEAAWIPGDDFFAAEISDTGWEARTPQARARDCIAWRRLRAEALEPLLAGQPAKWHPFDFEAGARPDGTYGRRADATTCEPAALIVLDGVYSTRPELADLIDLSVLIDVPVAVRHARLAAREEPLFLKRWHARWDAAEAYYFTHIRPKASFDLVVTPDQR